MLLEADDCLLQIAARRVDMIIDDILLALEHVGMPQMLVKDVVNGFVLVPFNELRPYAFVNREKSMYKFVFSSFDDLVETLFNAKEICHGYYPMDAQPNPLYGKSLEQLKIEKELTNS